MFVTQTSSQAVKSNKKKTRELANLTQEWVQQVIMVLNEPDIKDHEVILRSLKYEFDGVVK